MKPPAFTYCDPRTVDEALSLLDSYGFDAKILAGGQSLMPLLNLRLAEPAVLVDINRIKGLDGIAREGDRIRIGALTREAEVERSQAITAAAPLLAEAVGWIGHPAIRHRGTVGGSLAHADPAAELPCAMAALDAEFVVQSSGDQRVLGADEFFLTYMTTVLEPGEILREIRIPASVPRTGYGFREVSRRHGDFALVVVAATLTLGTDGSVKSVSCAAGGVGGTPVRLGEVEDLVTGNRPDADLLREAGMKAAQSVEPDSDLHASADFRRQLLTVLVAQALQQAATRAKSTEGGH